MLLRGAAIFAALFICAHSALSEEITLSSDDDGVTITGRMIGFDGELISILTDAGPTSLRIAGMTCVGDACPKEGDPQLVRVAGEPRLTQVLLPALLDAYARDQGFTIVHQTSEIRLSKAGRDVLEFAVRSGNVDTSFAQFLDNRVDVLLISRELTRQEAARAEELGLGAVSMSRQSRIISLDALVPVASPAANFLDISLRDFADVLAGKITDWSTFGLPPGAVSVHLIGPDDGMTDAFVARIMAPQALELTDNVIWHEDPTTLAEALISDKGAIGLLPHSNLSNAQPLALSGPCGLRTTARFLSLKTEDYPLTFPLFAYLPPRRLHPDVQAFLDWTRSASAQLVVRRAGLVDLEGVPIALSAQGDRLANAIRSAGVEVDLGELQRMIRVLSPRVRMSSTFRFEPGSTRLDGQSRSNVMQLAQAIQSGRYRGRDLILVGFSDGRGPALANRDLSSARAESVRRDLMVALGGSLPSGVALGTEAFGEAMPIACDDTLWGQQTNRRVELWVRDLASD